MTDPFETGTPKYSTAQDIYDALREMASGEEIGILSDMFSDVSWEGQDYYYTDNGSKLVEQWEETTDYGDKMWLMDVAVWQLSDEDANDWIYQILCNNDLAKRIGFKKLFVDNVLSGMSNQYKNAAEAFEEELHELNRNDFYANSCALATVFPSVAWDVVRYRYNQLTSAVYQKLKGLKLEAERQLIVESRAMLTGYDDFMFGLRSNQHLYTQLEKQYNDKVLQLKASYQKQVEQLKMIAEEQGITLTLGDSAKKLTQAVRFI